MSLTLFLQETRISCTVACLRMVLAHSGILVDEATLRAGCKTTESGTRAQDAAACARQYGFEAEEVSNARWQELEEWLAAGIYPIILLNLFPLRLLWVKHAVIAESADQDRVTYLDPIYGRQEAEITVFDQAWAMNRYRAILVKQSGNPAA